jgi:hypothetical protein
MKKGLITPIIYGKRGSKDK